VSDKVPIEEIAKDNELMIAKRFEELLRELKRTNANPFEIDSNIDNYRPIIKTNQKVKKFFYKYLFDCCLSLFLFNFVNFFKERRHSRRNKSLNAKSDLVEKQSFMNQDEYDDASHLRLIEV
jgi:hypothetical protein